MASNGLIACGSVFATGSSLSNYFAETGNSPIVTAANGAGVSTAVSGNDTIISSALVAGSGIVLTPSGSTPSLTVSTSPAVTATSVTASGTVQASNIVLQPSPAAGALFETGVAYNLFTPATDGIYLVNVSMETGSINVIVASCIVSVGKKSPAGPYISMITPLATPAGVSFSLTGGTAGPITYNQTVSVTQTTAGAGNSYGGIFTIAKLCQNTLF
jgi:hypothetical protein